MATSGKHSWIESSDVFSLFPTLAWKIQLRAEVHEPIDAGVLGLLHSLRQGLPELKAGEAWQSGHALHRREELRELCGCVSRAAASVLQFLKIGDEAIEITGCWASLNAPGASHRAHSHPNNYLSAVYYVRTSPGADTINFHDPRNQTGVIRPPVTELTNANTDQVVVRVKNGMLLVFPSYLVHSVDANASGVIRVSVSFNLMFSASAALSKPLWGEE
ncbi:MAG TPA: 2OG-Fe(II) oxygenase family protein [Burkholderiales bacterium]|nr:2OG-Fe(II) oxygenase family protein [Burkholderiales bacterium]